MLYILLTILFITLIGLTFKLFPKYNINAFQAIVFNYAVCVVMAWIHSGSFPLSKDVIAFPWFSYAIGLSFCFIIGFYLQSVIFEFFGIAVSSIVLKLSLLLTAIFSIIVYNEALPISKVLGLLLALASIVLVSYPKEGSLFKSDKIENKHWVILMVSYLIAAAVDIGFIYIERTVSDQSADPQFIGVATGLAFLWGALRESNRIFSKTSVLQLKNIIAGVGLGIINYLTFWGMLKSVATGIDPSIVFTSINIGVILIAALLGILFFKERLAKINILGIVTAVVAVFLIAYVV